MSWTRFIRRRRWHEERARELEAHLEMEVAENLSRGLSEQAARQAAQRKLGNPTFIREEIYRMNSIGFIENFWQDARYALRALRKSPSFTLVAILSLALGIGGNTAVFTVVNAVLLRPLPYAGADRVVRIAQKGNQAALSVPEYQFWKEHASSFESVAAYRGGRERALSVGTGQEWIQTTVVTPDFFRTLGVEPAMGREFTRQEALPGGPSAAVITEGLWRRSMAPGASPLGQAIKLDNVTYTVVGVLPASFWFPNGGDAFLPLRWTGSITDGGWNTQAIGRLKPRLSLSQAQAEMATLLESERRERGLGRNYQGQSAIGFHDWLVGDVRLNLLVLFASVVLLLLIACSNLASLMLARLAARRREIAVRLALGSGRGRLLRQLLIENGMLAAGGTAVALLCAYLLLDGFVALIPFHLPSAGPIGLDRQVMLFTLVVALGTAVVFTIAPFAASTRLNVNEALKAGGKGSAGVSRQRGRSFLVAGEVALSVTLVAAAVLLVESLFNLHREQLGFRPDGLLTFTTPLAPAQRRNALDVWNFQNTLLERLKSMPGARSVAAVDVLPLAGFHNVPTQLAGDAGKSIGGMEVRVVTPGYFEIMGIPVLRGRSFSENDNRSGAPVILVNEALARTWWSDASPLGATLLIGEYQNRMIPEIHEPPRQVAGVVGDTKTYSLKDRAQPTVFIPAAQAGDWFAAQLGSGMAWVVRGDVRALAANVRRVVAEIDPRQRLMRMESMEDIVAATTADSRFDAVLLAMLAGVALTLTAIGVYGLLAFSVAQRRHEIGTRMALGASRMDILRLILRHGVGLTAIGLCFGIAGALALARWLAALLFGIKPNDPFTFAMISVLLLAIGAAASYIPARRATRIDPMIALRYE